MSYVKQNFVTGQILQASQLNAMDDQIAENESASDIITETTDSTITLAWHDTKVVTNTPTALTVALPTPVSGKDCICGLCFKAGAGFALTDSAPTGCTIVWPDVPTWTAGNVYEIIYRYLGIDGIISAKYAEVSVSTT